jgi:hypothetical protein
VLAGGEAALEGTRRLGKREGRVDRDPKRAALDEARELDQLLPARFHDEVRPLPRLRGDRDETAAVREQRSGALQKLAADRVEDEIDRADPVIELPRPSITS